MSQLLNEIPLNQTDIPQSALNIEDRQRTNLFAWNGQFSPQLIEVLLNAYASPGQVVLDPFTGSGTVLYEAGRKGNPAIGVEINPAAFKMASIYKLMNVAVPERQRILRWVDDKLDHSIPKDLPLLASLDKKTAEQLGIRESLLSVLSKTQDRQLLEIVEALIIKLDFSQDNLDALKVRRTWHALRQLILSLPYTENAISVCNRDTRNLPDFVRPISLVVTSPPYINVFNYHQQYRASAESLGWNLLQVAVSEIGSNRKHRGNRYLTVIQYCLDMAQTLNHLAHHCAPDARLIFVVGRESSVLGTAFSNSNIIHLIASQCVGLKTEFRQERCFKNRFGQIIYEDILHLRVSLPDMRSTLDLERARYLAQEQLQSALQICTPGSAAGIEDALIRILDVQPSPIYDPELARKSAFRPRVARGANRNAQLSDSSLREAERNIS